MAKGRNKNEMWTSVSAIIDADDCFRRWWFNKVIKLPQDQRQATIFGDVFHAVQERFYMASDTGLDAAGSMVDLYPDGWMTMKSRFGKDDTLYTISVTEAALIKKLVDKSIADGVMVRVPGRAVEQEIRCVIHTQGRVAVVLVGFIDLVNPSELADHKTAKNTNYILSKNKLKKSIQMMGYAKYNLLAGHKGNLWLTHNNYIKDFDNPKVIQRSVEVTEMEINDFFNNTILPIVRRMTDYYIKYPREKIALWKNIPGANNPNQSCNHHYGKPCPYINICSGICSIDKYLIKYGTSVNELIGVVNTPQKGANKMSSLIETIANQNAAIAGAGAGVVAAPAGVVLPPGPVNPLAPVAPVTVIEEPAPVTSNGGTLSDLLAKMKGDTAPVTTSPDVMPIAAAAAENMAAFVIGTNTSAGVDVATAEGDKTVVAVQTLQQTAPWYTPYNGQDCPACKDSKVRGYNTNMRPCQICDARAMGEGKPASYAYDAVTSPDGTIIFTLKETGQVHTVAVVSEPVVTTETHPVETTAEPLVTTNPDAADATAGAIANGMGLKSTVLLTPEDVESAMRTEAGKSFTKKLEEDEAITKERDNGGVAVFSLLIGCVFVSRPDNMILYADDLLAGVLEDIETASGKKWSVIDHFALMQAIDASIPSVAEKAEGYTVISTMPAKGSALARLIEGLRLHANSIIQPLAN